MAVFCSAALLGATESNGMWKNVGFLISLSPALYDACIFTRTRYLNNRYEKHRGKIIAYKSLMDGNHRNIEAQKNTMKESQKDLTDIENGTYWPQPSSTKSKKRSIDLHTNSIEIAKKRIEKEKKTLERNEATLDYHKNKKNKYSQKIDLWEEKYIIPKIHTWIKIKLHGKDANADI